MQSDNNLEVEIKLALKGSPEGVLRRLKELGFTVSKPRVFESNVILDTPDSKLRNEARLLRVRRVGDSGVLTYKGPPEPGRHKSREEIESEISAPDRVELILARLGYAPSFRYEKYRTEFQAADQPGTVTFDETPIGILLELEGAPEWIDQTALALGFQESDYILKSYASLYREYCVQQGIPPTDMVFPKSDSKPA